MADRSVVIDLFVEDASQERLFSALIRRVAREERRHAVIRVAVAKGGHGRVLAELTLYQRIRPAGAPDVLVVGVDANCNGWNRARMAVQETLRPGTEAVIACPDPHVERWYLADSASLAAAFNVKAAVPKRKCGRDEYKQLLVKALLSGGNAVTLGGVEWADEIVEAMDLFRAGKAEPSLRHFVDDLRRRLK